MSDSELVFRPARPGEGGVVFDVTRKAVAARAAGHYSPDQIAGWMGERTPVFYEALIARGRIVIAARDGAIVGFVDSEPGELTRLFVLPEAEGAGIGRKLLLIGVEMARDGHDGPITVEATLNAETFYRRHGFRRLGLVDFSHGLGGPRITIVRMEL